MPLELQEITKIRERGQITIPAKFRHQLDWLTAETLVRIILSQSKLELKPLEVREIESLPLTKPKGINWNKVYKNMQLVSKSGKKVNLTKFLSKDRLQH